MRAGKGVLASGYMKLAYFQIQQKIKALVKPVRKAPPHCSILFASASFHQVSGFSPLPFHAESVERNR